MTAVISVRPRGYIRLALACIVVAIASYVGTVGHLETWCVETSASVWDCGDGPAPGVERNGEVYSD